MSLQVSHGCFDGGYSDFNQWRLALAKASGIGTTTVEIRSGLEREIPDVPDSVIPDDCDPWLGEWSKEPPDPIYYLLCHCNYTGVIKKDHCKPLAERLESMMPNLEGRDRDITEQFANGLRLAHQQNEEVRFS